MARDRSLDEFLKAESDDDPEEPEPEAEAGVDTENDRTETAPGGGSVEPAAVETTMAYAPEGSECAACGAVVQRRWQGENGLVCADCKEW